MTTAAVASPSTSQRGHLGLLVFASIAAGLALGVLLVLGVFTGGSEPQIVGSALLGLGRGFALLRFASAPGRSQSQQWALVPGVVTALAGAGLLVLDPGERI